MKPAVRARYTPAVRAAVATAAGGTPEALQDLGGFESFVHELDVGQGPYIVKATWGGRRSAAEMGAELHFVDYLAEHGAPVCRPRALRDGTLLTTVPCEGGEFHVTAWVKAPGASLTRAGTTPAAFEAWGALVGKLHRLSVAYPGPPAPCKRPRWEDEIGVLAEQESSESATGAAFRALLREIDTLPRTPAVFGAMHTDLHHGNIHWHEGRMQVFDFEDMIDFWFVSDLAVVLYYSVTAPEQSTRQALYEARAPALWAGYAREHELPSAQRAALPWFMALREHTLRAVLMRSTRPSERSPRLIQQLEEATARIERGEPALGLAF